MELWMISLKGVKFCFVIWILGRFLVVKGLLWRDKEIDRLSDSSKGNDKVDVDLLFV